MERIDELHVQGQPAPDAEDLMVWFIDKRLPAHLAQTMHVADLTQGQFEETIEAMKDPRMLAGLATSKSKTVEKDMVEKKTSHSGRK